MTGYERSDEDYQPLTWFRGYPVYATYFLVGLHVLSMLLFTLLEAALDRSKFYAVVVPLILSTDALIHHYAYWQVFTYAFVHPLSWNFVIGTFLLYLYGWELERFVGRKVFLTLYGALLLTTPLVLVVLSALTGRSLGYDPGSFALHFGIFIAFAVIYPSVQIFFGLSTKWIALILLAFYSLQFLGMVRADPGLLAVFWVNVLVGYFGVRFAGAGGGLSFLTNLRQNFMRRSIPAGVKPRLKPRRLVESGASVAGSATSGNPGGYGSGGELHDSIDPLLDKISKHGLASLTHSERAVLERARVSLLRKERGG